MPIYAQIFFEEPMLLHKRSNKDKHVVLVANRETETRLAEKRFRGPSTKRAGNLFVWRSVGHVFADSRIVEEVMNHVNDMIDRKEFGKTSFTIPCPHPIGWTNTDHIEKYPADALEWFRPNNKSRAMRVRPDRHNILAPQTKDLTIVTHFQSDKDRFVLQIHSLYPGVDIGDLVGNITEREKCVFFTWEHPGA